MSDTHQLPPRTKRGLDLATAADLADLFHELSQDPKTRKAIGKLIKEAKPDSPHARAFPDVDMSDQFEKFRQEQEEKELERQKAEMLRQMNAKRSALLSGGSDGQGRKYSEDDVKAIESLMQKKGISDYEDGATLYAATLPPIDPTPGTDVPYQHGSTWEIPEFAKFGDNPVKASRDTAHQVITEFMRKR
jgi:hypothetical protein